MAHVKLYCMSTQERKICLSNNFTGSFQPFSCVTKLWVYTTTSSWLFIKAFSIHIYWTFTIIQIKTDYQMNNMEKKRTQLAEGFDKFSLSVLWLNLIMKWVKCMTECWRYPRGLGPAEFAFHVIVMTWWLWTDLELTRPVVSSPPLSAKLHPEINKHLCVLVAVNPV